MMHTWGVENVDVVVVIVDVVDVVDDVVVDDVVVDVGSSTCNARFKV